MTALDRPDIPRWPEALLRDMHEIERTFRRHAHVYRPRLSVVGFTYLPLACLHELSKTTEHQLLDMGSADVLSRTIEHLTIQITGGFND